MIIQGFYLCNITSISLSLILSLKNNNLALVFTWLYYFMNKKRLNILYAIQGTGNGHLSRARDIIPILQSRGNLDLLISGTQADIHLPYEIKYRFNGLSFIFGKKGGVDLVETYKRGNIRRLLNEIKQLPLGDYDIVINDFEPVSAWACYLKNKPCISLSHQAAVLTKDAPKPKKQDLIGKATLKNYAPTTVQFGFHFDRYDQQTFTPVIRREVRDKKPTNKGHYTVYLPSYEDRKIITILSEIPNTHWQIFSKHTKEDYQLGNITISRINNERFIQSMADSAGILCGAGFETPAEALYMGKKLIVIPMKNQFEQHCNAAALKLMGVPVLKNLKKKQIPRLREWVSSGQIIPVTYPDETEKIIDLILSTHTD